MSTLPCQRPESPRDTDSGISAESALFLRAVGIAKARGFDWLQILPEDRGDWARRVLAQRLPLQRMLACAYLQGISDAAESCGLETGRKAGMK